MAETNAPLSTRPSMPGELNDPLSLMTATTPSPLHTHLLSTNHSELVGQKDGECERTEAIGSRAGIGPISVSTLVYYKVPSTYLLRALQMLLQPLTRSSLAD